MGWWPRCSPQCAWSAESAAAARAGRVVVSHIAAPSTEELQTRLGILRENYSGPVTVAEDLMCVEVQ